MANMPDINKRFVNALLPLELIARIDKEAATRKMTRTELMIWILDKQLETVQLSSNDFLWIAEQVKKNEDKRKGRK